jgi:hypothetical protein
MRAGPKSNEKRGGQVAPRSQHLRTCRESYNLFIGSVEEPNGYPAWMRREAADAKCERRPRFEGRRLTWPAGRGNSRLTVPCIRCTAAV